LFFAIQIEYQASLYIASDLFSIIFQEVLDTLLPAWIIAPMDSLTLQPEVF
jgi:hypothetical protein